MYKYFIFLSLFFPSFSGNLMAQENLYPSLMLMEDVAAPKHQEIKAYEEECGELPTEMKLFYLDYGNYYKDGFDILGIQRGKNSDLARNTKLIRRYLPSTYHAFADDQAEGGWWVYNATAPLKFLLFMSDNHKFNHDEIYESLKDLLNKE